MQYAETAVIEEDNEAAFLKELGGLGTDWCQLDIDVIVVMQGVHSCRILILLLELIAAYSGITGMPSAQSHLEVA